MCYNSKKIPKIIDTECLFLSKKNKKNTEHEYCQKQILLLFVKWWRLNCPWIPVGADHKLHQMLVPKDTPCNFKKQKVKGRYMLLFIYSMNF